MEIKKVGIISLDNKVDITDPCYDKDIFDRITTECVPGEYTGYIAVDTFDSRVNSLAIYLNDEKCNDSDFEEIGVIGVDSGMAGFFNNKQDFGYKEWEQFCNATDWSKRAWVGYNGVYSSSGYGDGGYSAYANKDRTAFKIEFIA